MNNNSSQSSKQINKETDLEVYDALYDKAKSGKEISIKNHNQLLDSIKNCDINDVFQISDLNDYYHMSDMNKEIFREYEIICNFIEISKSLDCQITLLKSKCRAFVDENRILKRQINESEKILEQKRCKLISMEESDNFHSFMLSLYKFEIDKEILEIEFNIWNQCIYEKYWLRTTSMSAYLDHLVQLISRKSVTEVVTFTKNVLLHATFENDGKDVYYQRSICLLLASKFCLESSVIEESLQFCYEAVNIAYKLGDDRPLFLAKLLSCLAVVLLKNKDVKQGILYLNESTQMLNYYSANDSEQKINLADHYVNVGNILCRLALVVEGVKFLKTGISIYSSLLPDEEERWAQTSVKVAKIYNEIDYTDEAIVLCERLMSCFHKIIYIRDSDSLKMKNIFEIALEVENMRTNNNVIDVSVPKAISLPNIVELCIVEIVVLFCKNNLLSAAQLLVKWLNICKRQNVTSSNNSSNKCKIQLYDDVNLMFEENTISSNSLKMDENVKCTNRRHSVHLRQLPYRISNIFKSRKNKNQSNGTPYKENINIKKLYRIFKNKNS